MCYTHHLNIVVFKVWQTLIKKNSLFVPARYKEGLNNGPVMSLLKGSVSFFADTCTVFGGNYFSMFAIFP